MKLHTFRNLLIAEINDIKKLSTPDELARLTTENLQSTSLTHSIFGQLTGYSLSDRAQDIQPKVFGGLNFTHSDGWKLDIEAGQYTILERYMMLANKTSQENVIRYLKGEVDTLILDFTNISQYLVNDETI